MHFYTVYLILFTLRLLIRQLYEIILCQSFSPSTQTFFYPQLMAGGGTVPNLSPEGISLTHPEGLQY